MAKKSLKNFDPDKTATLEMEAWRAYYKHRFFKLFIVLLALMRTFFSFNWFLVFQAGYYTADATIDFRLNKGKENQPRVLNKLKRFFKVLSNNTVEKFDSEKAAELELNWWFVDRYPNRYEMTREEAIARAMAFLYGRDFKDFMHYADYRAKAMVLQDVAEEEKREADWNQIESLLKISGLIQIFLFNLCPLFVTGLLVKLHDRAGGDFGGPAAVEF